MRVHQYLISMSCCSIATTTVAAGPTLSNPVRHDTSRFSVDFQGYAQQGVAWTGSGFVTSMGTCNDPLGIKSETISFYNINDWDHTELIQNVIPNRCHFGDLDVFGDWIYLPATTYDETGLYYDSDTIPAILRFSLSQPGLPDVYELPEAVLQRLGTTGDAAGIYISPLKAYLVSYQPQGSSNPGAFVFSFDIQNGIIDTDSVISYPISTRYANGIYIYENYLLISNGQLDPFPEAWIDVYDVRDLNTMSTISPIYRVAYDFGLSQDIDCLGNPDDLDFCPHAEGLTIRGDELWVCAEEGRALYQYELADMELPDLPDTVYPIITISEPTNGSSVAPVFNFTTFITDSSDLGGLSVSINGQTIQQINNPSSNQPYTFQIDANAFIGQSITIGVQANDQEGHISNESISAHVEPSATEYEIFLTAAPQTLLLDGSSFASLTATVVDGVGTPTQNQQVTFSVAPGLIGSWVDPSGNSISNPSPVSTDSSGRAYAQYRPAIPNTSYQFTSSIQGDSANATVFTLGTGDGSVIISPPRFLRFLTNGWAEYSIQVCFEDSLGNPIQNGCAQLTTTLGFWDEGAGSGTSVTLSDIGSSGCTTVDIQVPSGTGTITVELCNGSQDCGDSISDCDGSGLIGQESFTFATGNPPPVISIFEVPNQYPNEDKSHVSSGNDRAAIVTDNRAITVYDMHSWEVIRNWYEGDHSNTSDIWKNPTTMALSSNGRYIFTSDYGDGIAILDVDTGNITAGYHARGFEEDAAWNPENNRVVVAIEDVSADRDGFGIYTNGAAEITTRALGSGSEDTRVRGVDWSTGNGSSNQRIAVAYEKNLSSDEGYVAIISASSFNTIATFTTPDPTDFDPGDVEWSPDGNRLAVFDDNDAILYILNRSGQSVSPGPIPVSSIGNAATITWSPDGQYITLHNRGGASLMYNSSSGQLAARISDGNSQNITGYDTHAWREDSEVIVHADANWNNCRIFTPFDSDPPFVAIDAPLDGTVTTETSVLISGTAFDGVGLHPNSIRMRMNGASWIPIEFNVAAANYSTTASLNLGSNLIEVECTDLSGQITVAQSVITVAEPGELRVFLGSTELTNNDSIDFGSAEVGDPDPTRTITLQNTGGFPILVNAVNTEEPFYLLPGGSPLIEAYSSSDYPVSLPTDSAGVYNSTLFIDTDVETVTLNLTGMVTEPCYPDFNGDRTLNFFDVSLFVQRYQAKDPSADCNGDGAINFFDVSCFIMLYQSGCP